MIHQQAIEEMNIVLSQCAQIQEPIYVRRLESKLCQAYLSSILQRIFQHVPETDIFSSVLHMTRPEVVSDHTSADTSGQV